MLRALMALFVALTIAAPAATAQAPTQDTAWFYIVSNQVQGPYLLGEVQDMARQGVIRPSTQVHGPGRGWAFARDTPELQQFLADAAPPPPPGAPVPPSYPPAAPAYPPAPSYPPEPPVQPVAPVDRKAEMEGYLIGHWRTVSRQEMAGRQFETTLEFDFRADGSYGGFISTSMPDSPDLQPLTEEMRGRWQVLPLDAKSLVLTTDVGNGMPPEQVALTIVDDATMVSNDGRNRYIRVR
jgi:hypothetical protein